MQAMIVNPTLPFCPLFVFAEVSYGNSAFVFAAFLCDSLSCSHVATTKKFLTVIVYCCHSHTKMNEYNLHMYICVIIYVILTCS